MPAAKTASSQKAVARKNSRPTARKRKVAAKKAPPEVPRQYTAEELWDEEESRFFQPYFDRLAGKKA